jgi:hypothetical protein
MNRTTWLQDRRMQKFRDVDFAMDPYDDMGSVAKKWRRLCRRRLLSFLEAALLLGRWMKGNEDHVSALAC